MLFNTLDFFAFLLAALLLFLILPRWRKWVVLGASLLFYGSYSPAILALLMITVAANYLGARRIAPNRAVIEGSYPAGSDIQSAASVSSSRQDLSREPSLDPIHLRNRRWILAGCVSLNMAFLGFFKYTSMLLYWGGMAVVQEPLEAPFDILLPVGISFYTFQITSYVVDVYRGQKPEEDYSKLLLFTVYFPQLVAGPIERASRLLPELNFSGKVPAEMVRTGLLLCLWGYFKKVYVADNLSPLVDYILVLEDPPAGAMAFATVLFPLQLYADFTGYTDIARGLSRMMGIELSLNFFHPFLSTNHIEFWRRWHITLGAFLRDYLYIPMGGNRVGAGRAIFNIMLVWALGGLWHGATAGYFIWGLYCGILVAVTGATLPLIQAALHKYSGLRPWLAGSGRLFTFLTFALGLLILRAPGADRLVEMLFLLGADGPQWIDPDYILLSLVYLIPMLVWELWRILSREEEPWQTSWVMYPTAFLWITLIWVAGRFEAKEFFYFQF
ncbi:MAG: MBOAT family protein [Leptospiraceae bacterium]|nr:MBOAT family protein [Leptospiraceae bacterium]